MSSQPYAFWAVLPKEGFRWLKACPDGSVTLDAPPSDWPPGDYKAADLTNDLEESFTEAQRYFLACSWEEWLDVEADARSDRKVLIADPHLYLEFASAKPTPDRVLEMINRYGFLRPPVNNLPNFTIKGSQTAKIVEAFKWRPRQIELGEYEFFAEAASNWMTRVALVNQLITLSNDLQNIENTEQKSFDLESTFNFAMSGNLSYKINVDPSNGSFFAQIIANSLHDALDVQWAMALLNDVSHRDCEVCGKVFAIGPGAGSQRKKYCSNACQMRAHRKRKKEDITRPRGGQ